MAKHTFAFSICTRKEKTLGTSAALTLGIFIVSLWFSTGCGSSSHAPTFPVAGNYSNTSLSGHYAFLLTGTRVISADGMPMQSLYQEAGVLTADGNGNITGSQDVHVPSSFAGFTSTLFKGSYSIGTDGNGTVQLNVNGGIETWSITMVSTSKFYLAEADANASYSANASGQGELQDPSVLNATPSGSFAFRVHQTLLSPPSSAMVGQFTVPLGQASGQADTEQGGALSSVPTALVGVFSAPDKSGRGTLQITLGGTTTNSFNYYIVNSSTLTLLESDAAVLGVGRAEAQSLPFNTQPLNGNYAFGTHGDTQNNLNGVNSAGVFNLSGSTVTRTYDSSRDGQVTTNQNLNGLVQSFDPGSGRLSVSFTPTGSGIPIQEVWYVVNPARAMVLVFYPNLAEVTEDGTLDQQVGSSFSKASLKGQFGLLLSGFNQSGLFTRVGTFIPDGNGNLNINESDNLLVAATATAAPVATFTAPVYVMGVTYDVAQNGRATANADTLVLYLVSGNHAYMLQSTPGAQMFGPLEMQQ